MIADVPPFYVKFVRSLLQRRRMARLQTAMPKTVEAVSVKLVPMPDVKRLPEPATALRRYRCRNGLFKMCCRCLTVIA